MPRVTLRSLLADEHEAIRNYRQAERAQRHSGRGALARLLTHIQGEEEHHAEELTGQIKRGFVGRSRGRQDR